MITVRQLIWEQINIDHIKRHDITQNEVEEVCHSEPYIEQGYKGRLRIIGYTQTGKPLAVILAPKETDVYYPVTARPASKKERQRYNTYKRGIL